MTESETVTLGHLVDSGFCVLKNNLREPLSKMQRSQMKEGPLYPYYGAANAIDEINDYKFEGFHLLVAEDGTVTSNGIAPMLQLVDGKFWVSNHAHVLQCASKWQTRLLYYLLCNVDINPYITGAVQPKLNKKNLLSILIRLPSSNIEQRAIAGILSALDDKIDLLHRQNQTLEALAQTLFRQWFIEEAEDDWKEVALGDIVKVSIGRTPPRKEKHWFSTDRNDVKWISIKDMGDSGVFIFNTNEYLKREAILNFNIPIIPKNTVILSFKMTVGRVGITTEEMVSNEAIAHFTFEENTPICKEYLYFFLKDFRYELLGSTSSIVTSINSKIIRDMNILVPPNKVMLDFQESVGCFFAKIKHNQTQIETLKELRDTLLPKLMSGEVRVRL